MFWKDYVSAGSYHHFMEKEVEFTKYELNDFYKKHNGGSNTDIEAARARVLSKRYEFLALWIEGEV